MSPQKRLKLLKNIRNNHYLNLSYKQDKRQGFFEFSNESSYALIMSVLMSVLILFCSLSYADDEKSYRDEVMYHKSRYSSYQKHLEIENAFHKKRKSQVKSYKENKELAKKRAAELLKKYIEIRPKRRENFEAGEADYLKKITDQRKGNQKNRSTFIEHKNRIKKIIEENNHILLEDELDI
jgi:hypothetical protein